MNLNECPYPPSPVAVRAMRAACETVNRYPDPSWGALVAAVSARTGIAASRIVVGNGSDELIVNAGRVALEPGDEVVVPVPSFPGYNKCAALFGARVVAVPVRDDGAVDVDAMLAATGPRTRLVFAATPNNPTGAMLPAADVARLAAAVPSSALLVIDEAYHEFAIHAGGDEHLPALARRDGPWASFRTLSKAYGLAGIRVGYCLAGSDDLAQAFQKVRAPFNVNAVAQAGALAAWDDLDHVHGILDATRVERERIAAGLRELGCEPFPSVANFVTARTPRAAAEVVAGLETRGVLISRLMAPGFEQYIRVTVGLPEDTDAVLDGLADLLGRR
ncbi:MAG: aminotransferase class I/II-fold pyridoxal phosphate-dependent enzyme [Ectothiorhodospiraceae bacterium]|nr:aminotransferase class I/II-fold pyridoxal phosphate-dependent enzyme [Chromatiales bacterium]MCP5154511.1 aminotransferase class I/II-fold pyridoxal phosphate-dependent enzyme [Ectothiorhodospiraceae bacterium]